MKMLIEKQAAAAARLNSPSRLEAFAADSPPRRRRRRPTTPTKASGGGDAGGSRRGSRDADSSSPPPRRTASAGGIALSELVSATSPPRRRPSAIKIDASGKEAAAQRQSLAKETYTKTFTGMQVWNVGGTSTMCPERLREEYVLLGRLKRYFNDVENLILTHIHGNAYPTSTLEDFARRTIHPAEDRGLGRKASAKVGGPRRQGVERSSRSPSSSLLLPLPMRLLPSALSTGVR